jgi:DNA-directed RNA polymerase subunit omega
MASGIVEPPIDELLEKTKSKYVLSVLAAKRARQINSYYAQLSEGLLENVGPLVDSDPKENPVNIAMREIREGFISPNKTPE